MIRQDQSKPRVNWLNTVFLLGTFLGAAVAVPWYLATVGLAWPEALTFVVLYLLVGLSVTAGYHRLFAHRTYQAAWPVRLFFLVFGAAALENSVLNWAADHRVHHDHTDDDRDPYNIQKGFWWAHIGWIFFDVEPAPSSIVRDLAEDPLVRWQARWYKAIGLGVAFGIPLAVGLATGRVLGCLVIGGLLRVVVSHHGTFFINSLCHMVGHQPYSREHSARDSGVMAVLAFGEGYHNYHHSFPHDYRNGVKPWHFDPAKWMIYLFARVGLARDLRRTPQAQILKAKVEIQFERAKEKLSRAVHELRHQYEIRLHEAHAKLQGALHDLLTLQKRQKAEAEGDHPSLEERLASAIRSVEHAWQEWKELLSAAHRLPAVA